MVEILKLYCREGKGEKKKPELKPANRNHTHTTNNYYQPQRYVQ